MNQTSNTCLLSQRLLQQRLNRIQQLAERFLLEQRQDGSALQLRYAVAAESELQELVVAEKDCCAFLDFLLHKARDHVELTITASNGEDEFTRTLFAHFQGEGKSHSGCGSSSCSCA